MRDLAIVLLTIILLLPPWIGSLFIAAGKKENPIFFAVLVLFLIEAVVEVLILLTWIVEQLGK